MSEENSTQESKALDRESCFGMWKDREDMKDSTAWVRKLRQKEWSNSSASK